MPLNMFGIQYSGLSRMHRYGEIFDAAILEQTKEIAFSKICSCSFSGKTADL